MEAPGGPRLDWTRVILGLIPLALGGLVTLAWQNSHTLAALTASMENMRVDVETTKAGLMPGRTIQLRLDLNERELGHLRGLIERQIACPQVPANRQ
jgi:hypothetical protein